VRSERYFLDMISHKSSLEKAEIRLSKNLKRTLSQLKDSKDKKEAFKVRTHSHALTQLERQPQQNGRRPQKK
jgi:hypothetical protein